jgi:hypothetical protein
MTYEEIKKLLDDRAPEVRCKDKSGRVHLIQAVRNTGGKLMVQKTFDDHAWFVPYDVDAELLSGEDL